MCIWQLLLGLLWTTSKWSSTNATLRIYCTVKGKRSQMGIIEKHVDLRSMLLGPWCKSFWRDQRYRAVLQPACCMLLWVIQWTVDWCRRWEGCGIRSEGDRVIKLLHQHQSLSLKLEEWGNSAMYECMFLKGHKCKQIMSCHASQLLKMLRRIRVACLDVQESHFPYSAGLIGF